MIKYYLGLWLAARGILHELVPVENTSDKNYKTRENIKLFWDYLKSRIQSKGGVRRQRIPLYLAEYNWRYYYQNESPTQQRNQILKMLEK